MGGGAAAIWIAFVTAGAAISSADASPAQFPGLAAAKSPLYSEVRHRWRRHRRIRSGREKEENKAASQETGNTANKSAPASAPSAAEQPPKETGKASNPEPAGPPPPPPEWSAAEVQAAWTDCSRRLSGLHILYDRVAPLKEGPCGSPAPISLKGFNGSSAPGVSFSPAPTVSCKLAEALYRWFEDVIQPNAKTYLHGSVVHIRTLSAYNCRARYDDPSLRISQHAFANAVDIGEFVTAKGEHIAVLDHWNAGDERAAFLHKIHGGACEIFGTTLGPEANEAHKNHFHLDMKERRRPLCDFTPEQVRAQEEAKKRVPVPAATEGHTAAGSKPEQASCSSRNVTAGSNAPAQSRSQKCEGKAQPPLDRYSAGEATPRRSPEAKNAKAKRSLPSIAIAQGAPRDDGCSGGPIADTPC